MDTLLRPLGLVLAHLSPLMLLHRDGPMLQRDLVRGLGVGQPGMVHAIARLEEGGFISRRPAEKDRRATIIELTDKGRETVEVASPFLVEANAHALSGFTAEESRTLTTLLQRLIANLESDG
ncbi:winged helix DNA-binding protein [Enterovirga sp. DB1703]|uniref:Winged helix DNA-binding protein n=2 Tax=Enterovirga aerilata TaxID=2730920 RepID=A0A849I7H2_9HYPH|nr:MarR family transcriptional regulator [Enterovirga sp. DB1703]NNM71977.1 winged helix DNA-binding protein [Enterovirga sp. DB1703]